MSRLVCFGDSITWGSDDPDGGWVARLRREGMSLRDGNGDYVAVYNCGISGDKVGDVLGRIRVEAEARVPDTAVVAIGINDVPHNGESGTSPRKFERAYRDLLIAASDYVDWNIVVLGPTNVDEARPEHNYRNGDIEALRDVTATLASENGLTFVDMFGLMLPEDVASDGLHPVASGHEKIYQAVRPAVFSLPPLARFAVADPFSRPAEIP